MFEYFNDSLWVINVFLFDKIDSKSYNIMYDVQKHEKKYISIIKNFRRQI